MRLRANVLQSQKKGVMPLTLMNSSQRQNSPHKANFELWERARVASKRRILFLKVSHRLCATFQHILSSDLLMCRLLKQFPSFSHQFIRQPSHIVEMRTVRVVAPPISTPVAVPKQRVQLLQLVLQKILWPWAGVGGCYRAARYRRATPGHNPSSHLVCSF